MFVFKGEPFSSITADSPSLPRLGQGLLLRIGFSLLEVQSRLPARVLGALQATGAGQSEAADAESEIVNSTSNLADDRATGSSVKQAASSRTSLPAFRGRSAGAPPLPAIAD